MTATDFVAIMRPVALASAALQLLCVTILWRPLYQHVLAPWLRSMEDAGTVLPLPMRSEKSLRIFGGLMMIPVLFLWWELGRPEVIEAFKASTP